MMLAVAVEGARVRIGERFSVSFQRTLRIPDDGQAYPLPPGLGAFPIYRVADNSDRVPSSWLEQGGIFIPMYQREALWLGFSAAHWKPNAVKVGTGAVNAVSGLPWDEALHADPQDYIVCPDQPWLDGINAGDGDVRQFVAMPLGAGYTVAEQVSADEAMGGIQLLVFEPKAGRFPDLPPPAKDDFLIEESAPQMDMGLAAGGRIVQKIYPDPYGIEVWDHEERGALSVHIVNSAQFRELTGLAPPPSPIDARTYTERGFPWFALYDEAREDLPAAPPLTSVKSVRERDAELGIAGEADDTSVEIAEGRVKRLHHREGRDA